MHEIHIRYIPRATYSTILHNLFFLNYLLMTIIIGIPWLNHDNTFLLFLYLFLLKDNSSFTHTDANISLAEYKTNFLLLQLLPEEE